MIKVSNLSKSYEKRQALSGLSFSVGMGEVCALTGLKGSGKTTALDIVAGCMDADSGTVKIDGKDIAAETSSARQHIGYVPARPPVWPGMTARACLKMNADARGLTPRESGERIDAALKRLDLREVADTPLKRLTPGALQMTAIAQAIFFDPEVILIDEPQQSLNPREILTFRAAIRELGQNHAVLMASSNLSEMCQVCTRVLVLSQGQIVSEGTPDQLHNMTQIADTLTLALQAEEAAAMAALSKTPGVTIESAQTRSGLAVLTVGMRGDRRADLFRAAAAANLPIVEMTPARKPLNELLESLVSERVGGEDQ